MKYELLRESLIGRYGENSFQMRDYQQAFDTASVAIVGEMINEIAATHEALRSTFQPKDRYDNSWEDLQHAFELRWQDLVRCAELDGYRIPVDEIGRIGKTFVPIEPEIEGQVSVEDDLTSNLRASGLPKSDEIVRLIGASGDHFRSEEYNACLNAARVALQSLATAIAEVRREDHPGEFDEDRWGSIIGYFKTSGFITQRQERGLVGVFGFVSDGSHVPVGFTEEEYVRLGRHLFLSMAYFLVRIFRAS